MLQGKLDQAIYQKNDIMIKDVKIDMGIKTATINPVRKPKVKSITIITKPIA